MDAAWIWSRLEPNSSSRYGSTDYYVRVLQLPTARWTLYDEIREGVTYADDVKRQIVERAWGSPIWYEVN